ncbi:MAG: hypothetical protein WBD37_04385 [Anderseniella sp.]
MDIPNQKNRNILRPLLVVSLLVLAVAVVLNACVMPTIMPSEDAAAIEVSGAVEATVDAAIALAVKATLTSVSADDRITKGTTVNEGQEVAAVTTASAGATSGETDATSTVETGKSTEGPMLITPTPDRSAEIMGAIAQNTRHFKGNSDAAVVIVEFSDFQ